MDIWISGAKLPTNPPQKTRQLVMESVNKELATFEIERTIIGTENFKAVTVKQ